MRAALALLAALAVAGGAAAQTPRPDDARLYIVAPADGATVSNPVTVVFGLAGMGIAPAGVDHPDTGHHHLLIDTAPAALDLSAPLPATDRIRHFGGGRTQATLALPTGEHELRLLLADADHIPHRPPLASAPIRVTVTD